MQQHNVPLFNAVSVQLFCFLTEDTLHRNCWTVCCQQISTRAQLVYYRAIKLVKTFLLYFINITSKQKLIISKGTKCSFIQCLQIINSPHPPRFTKSWNIFWRSKVLSYLVVKYSIGGNWKCQVVVCLYPSFSIKGFLIVYDVLDCVKVIGMTMCSNFETQGTS